MTQISIIIPSHNEQEFIETCLKALTEQVEVEYPVEVIVAANACSDETVARALQYKSLMREQGWKFHVLRIKAPGKVNALNVADRFARGKIRIYLDADVVVGARLVSEISQALDTEQATYATGKLDISPAKSWVTRQYAKLWAELPFMKSKAVGAGLFAVNVAGRARWEIFPDIISDDTYIRLLFAPNERIEVAERYQWPMVEGLKNLIKVRKRQDQGVIEVARLFPDLMSNEDKQPISKLGLFFKQPISFGVYAFVSICVRVTKSSKGWTRGR